MRRVSVVAYVVAIVLFVLAGLGVDVGSLSELDLVAFGLAAFALAHVAP
jgi:hypothetical protein